MYGFQNSTPFMQTPQQQQSWGGWGQQQPSQAGLFDPGALSGGGQGWGGWPSFGGGGGAMDWTSFFGGLGGLFGGGGMGSWQGNTMPYAGENPAARGSQPSSFGPQPPSNFQLPQNNSTGVTPTAPTYTANPVTDPNLAAFQSWGTTGGAPTLIPSATASFLGYGTAPPGTNGYNPNTGQWM